MASLASFDPYSIKPGKFEPSEFVRPAKKQKKEKAAKHVQFQTGQIPCVRFHRKLTKHAVDFCLSTFRGYDLEVFV